VTRSRTFYRVRVGLLLSVLLVVLIYAAATIRRRRARNDWQRTVNVAVVLVRMGPVDEAAIVSLRDRARVLEDHLTRELHRHRATPEKAFSLVMYGPVDATEAPPVVAGEGMIDLLKHNYAQWRWLRKIDARAAIDCGPFDSCVYLVVRPPAHERQWFVEGSSEQGGRIGIIEVELDPAMVDFALFVTTHELLHTLGALDKYDGTGRTLVPIGLAEPEASPLYPQRFVEIMARGRPISEGSEKPPETLEELRIGPVTATEIGWSLAK